MAAKYLSRTFLRKCQTIFNSNKADTNLQFAAYHLPLPENYTQFETEVDPPDTNRYLVSRKDEDAFKNYFYELVQDICYQKRFSDLPPGVRQRILDGLYYNIPIGPMERGLTVLSTYRAFETPENITPENIRLANILGWILEIVSKKKVTEKKCSRLNAACSWRTISWTTRRKGEAFPVGTANLISG